jgi:hypothetical protein
LDRGIIAIMVFANSEHFALYFTLMSIAGEALFLVQTMFPVILYRLKSQSIFKRLTSALSAMASTSAVSKVQTLQLAIDSMMGIIHSPNRRDAFKKFLEKEFAVENLLFIEAWEQDKSNRELIEAIMDNLIVATAPSCVNLPCQTRDQLVYKFDEMMKNEDFSPRTIQAREEEYHQSFGDWLFQKISNVLRVWIAHSWWLLRTEQVLKLFNRWDQVSKEKQFPQSRV